MMAGNFQQMGNAGGNPMMMQQQAQGPVQNSNIQLLLLQNIRGSTPQPLTGWHATVAEAERLNLVFQLVTQLRLANPNQELTKICQNALVFEKQSFDNVHDKDSYLKLIQSKLVQLTTARSMSNAQLQAAQTQAQQPQVGMANQGGGMGQPFQQGMQQLQNMQHLQQQMQPSPMQGQQQPQQMPMGMGNNMLGQNIPPSAQFQMNMQQQQQQQAQMQVPQGSNPKPQPQFTPQEQQIIVGMTKQLMASTPEPQKQQLRQKLQSEMDPAQLERFAASRLDPLHQFFQKQAIARYRQQRAQQQVQHQAQQQGGQGMSMGLNRSQGAIPMQQQRSGNPNPMVPQPQQGQQLGIPGNQDFGFLDTQQNQNPQDGNQLGMQPSLSQQGNTTPQNMAGLPVQAVTPNNQRVVQNPQMRQQQFNSQQQAALQAQAHDRARKVQMAALQGQAGGIGPMPPNQSPAMNPPNAPLAGTPQQNAGGQGQAVSQPAPSQFGQPIDPRFAGMNQRPGVNAQSIAFPNNLSAEQRQRLQQMPPERLNEMLAKWNEANAQRAAMNLQNQQSGLAGGMAGGGQMMQNSGGAQPQLGQQNMANPMNQFMQNGQPMQRPPSQMQAGMTPQQQALLRQQMQQRQMQNAGAPQPQVPTGDLPGGPPLDQIDFPQLVYTIIPRQLIPQGLSKWGLLKQWIVTHGNASGLNVESTMDKISQMQRAHMAQLMRNRQMQQQNQQNQQRMAAGLGPLGGQQPSQPGQLGLTPQMAQQLAQMQAMQQPQITMLDIQGARDHPSGRWSALNDDQIRQHLMTTRRHQQIQFLRQQQLQQQQQQQQQQMQNQQFNQHQMGQMPQMSQMPGQNLGPNGLQRPVGLPQQQGQPVLLQGMKRPQSNQLGAPAGKNQPQAPMEAKQTPQARSAKPTQPTSSPAQPPSNNKKRASSDDVVEVPNPNAQVNRPQMQPSQQGMGQRPPGFPMFTKEQLNAMPADKRQKYIEAVAVMRQRQAAMAAMGPQPSQTDIEHFNRIRQDEGAKWKQAPPINMSPEERNRAIELLRPGANRINQVFQIAPKWFAISKDEQRLRSFFRAHLSVNDQFEDGAKAQRPKASLSMRQQDVQNAMAISTSIVQDVAAKYPEMMKGRPVGPGQAQPPNAAGTSAQGQQQQPGAGPAPLNAANLQQQQQALSAAQKENSKQQMQRASMSNKAPPAPTTAHAPNAQIIGQANAQAAKAQPAHHASPAHQPQFAVNSPQGVPAMYGPAKIDQGQLRLPPTKKRKAEGGMTSSGNTPVQPPKSAPGPNGAQAQSQPMMKQESQHEQKPPSNTQPEQQQQQPQQPTNAGFICQDRDCEGVVPPFASEEKLQQHREEQHVRPFDEPIPFLMGEMESYLGLDKKGTAAEAHAASVAMKQDASSTGKPSPNSKPKSTVEMPPPADAWAASSVNPQEIMQVFKPFEAGANGAISNIDAYRSITPNDTPESTESGKGSEPNSDITEGTGLDINMQFEEDANWNPFGDSDLDAFIISEAPREALLQEGFGGVEDGMVLNELEAPLEDNGGWDQFVEWEEPDKPFNFDAGLFEMDGGSNFLN